MGRHLFDRPEFKGCVVLLDRVQWFSEGPGSETARVNHRWFCWSWDSCVEHATHYIARDEFEGMS